MHISKNSGATSLGASYWKVKITQFENIKKEFRNRHHELLTAIGMKYVSSPFVSISVIILVAQLHEG